MILLAIALSLPPDPVCGCPHDSCTVGDAPKPYEVIRTPDPIDKDKDVVILPSGTQCGVQDNGIVMCLVPKQESSQR